MSCSRDAEREAIFAAMTLDEKLAAREMLKQQVADLKRKVADLDQQLADQERAAREIIIDLGILRLLRLAALARS